MSVPAGENTLIDAATGAPFPAVPAQTLLGSSRTLGWRGILVEWHRLPPDELPPHYVIGHGISVSTTSHPVPFGWRGRRGWQDRAINPGESHLLTHGELNTPRRHRPFDGLSLVLDPQFVADVVQEHLAPNHIEFISQRSVDDPILSGYGQFSAARCSPNRLEALSTSTRWRIEPGGMKTDFFTRSFDSGSHRAYSGLIERVMGVITDPKTMATYSTPDQIAEVVYEAATDGEERLRYVAGADAKSTYAARLQAGDEAFRKGMDQQFFG